ncbi:hypothetical protein PGT21_012055 [Puccinia graminis f. sp. tritici]|uniref:Uncharacterized protein n=1 Tax=Puccinia graminis f. sp. tritici TaxID=56615 RepID=A0A5B0NMF9_PUCGR|nr:hypothetical protein PGT21_012055 [Puccinia graminis f. sp. tritici]KAA1089973.1 hypothetical protein PGTUg99_031994 [Puccinia graminis f. sp. tritici]
MYGGPHDQPMVLYEALPKFQTLDTASYQAIEGETATTTIHFVFGCTMQSRCGNCLQVQLWGVAKQITPLKK